MKKHVLLALLLCAMLPIFGQTSSELKSENARLKVEVQQLKDQLSATSKKVVELSTRIKVAENVLRESNSDSPASNKTTISTDAPASYPTIIANDEESASAKVVQTNQSAQSGLIVGQCKALTQAGSQCKRNAAEGSSYCWQHQTKAPSSTTAKSSSTSTSGSGRTIYTGPRGGKYYINSNGNKTYIRR